MGIGVHPLLALTQVETVGLWIGILSGVVSIVLSVVAILFAWEVDRRSMAISHQTIRSLETIQATVQRLSDDTGGLIKVAWERMFGTMAPLPATDRPPPVGRELQGTVSGLLAEFRQDANELAPGTSLDKLARDVGDRVSRAASRTTPVQQDGAPSSWAFNAAVTAIESLSPLAIELLRALEGNEPLTRLQYQQLRRDPELALALDELRDQDILMPVQRRGDQGEQTVYGLAPWFHRVIGPALVFTGHESLSSTESRRVAAALNAVGYPAVEDSKTGVVVSEL